MSYAALRELHAVQQAPSFYNNHQSRIESLYIEDTPPFQPGDCYLIGGDGRLEYETALENIANFVYLQGTTSLSERLPLSDINRGFFASFGVQIPHNQQKKSRQISRQRYEALVLQNWLAQTDGSLSRYDD